MGGTTGKVFQIRRIVDPFPSDEMLADILAIYAFLSQHTASRGEHIPMVKALARRTVLEADDKFGGFLQDVAQAFLGVIPGNMAIILRLTDLGSWMQLEICYVTSRLGPKDEIGPRGLHRVFVTAYRDRALRQMARRRAKDLESGGMDFRPNPLFAVTFDSDDGVREVEIIPAEVGKEQ